MARNGDFFSIFKNTCIYSECTGHPCAPRMPQVDTGSLGNIPTTRYNKTVCFFLNLAIFFEFWCHYLFDPVKIGWNRFYSCQKYTIYAKIPRLPLGVTMRGGGKSPRNVDKPHIRSGYVHILGMIWQTKRSIVLAFFC